MRLRGLLYQMRPSVVTGGEADAGRLIRDLDVNIKKDGDAVVKVANPGRKQGVSLAFIISVPRRFNAEARDGVILNDFDGENGRRTHGSTLLATINGGGRD